tara:strand:+ start:7520 stop:7708 length:189 start_codon:yes stop_codon:yes gene_type:complete
MAKRRRTKLVRVYSEMDTSLKLKFPGVRSADLYQFMFHSSALKVEAWLRTGYTGYDRKKRKK